MQQSDEMSSLCHDIRNMLMSIQLAVGDTSKLDNPREVEMAEKVNYAVSKCTSFCNQVIKKQHANDPEEIAEHVNVGNLANEIAHYLERKNAKKLNFNIECENYTVIKTCRVALYRVLLNIAENAVFATLSAGRSAIQISISQVNNTVNIEVHDGGKGFPVSLMCAIDDGSILDSRRNAGLHGIGLPSTIEMVNELGGEFFIKQSGMKGSVVQISLPQQAASVVDDERKCEELAAKFIPTKEVHDFCYI